MPLIDEAYLCKLKKTLQKEALKADEGDPLYLPSALAEQSENLKTSHTTEDAFKLILRLCAVKERATSDLKKRLSEKSFSESAIEDAIERAKACGLLDDIRFAESLVRMRRAAGKGQQGIEAELARLAIDPYEIQGWPEDFFPSESEEVKRAIALLTKKPPTAKNKRDSAYRRLIGKGYSSSVSSTAARLWFEGLNNSF